MSGDGDDHDRREKGDGEKRRRRTGAATAGNAQRGMVTRVKTAKKRTHSSTLWLQRQLNDPYVAKAKEQGYRSRATFKLTELDDKYRLIRRGARVVDLGAAPGGWVQAALQRGASKVVGVDYLEMDPIEGAELLQLDFTDEGAPEKVQAALGGRADLVMSDMAAPTTGHRMTDQTRTGALAEAAAEFAMATLAPGGAFVTKAFQGGVETALLDRLKKAFAVVRHAKPAASRQESKEVYLVATGFRGLESSPAERSDAGERDRA